MLIWGSFMRESTLETRNAIINSTMNLVATYGLEGFSISQLCSDVGLTKGAIYSHFESKEDMLYQCFLCVNKDIANLFSNQKTPVITSKSKLEKYLHDQWIAYFNLMLDNGNRSLFYYAYRESENIDRILMRNNKDIAKEMSNFSKLTNAILEVVGKKIPVDYIMVHIIDGTGIYVKHILKNHIDREDVNPEQLWNLIFKGIKGIL